MNENYKLVRDNLLVSTDGNVKYIFPKGNQTKGWFAGCNNNRYRCIRFKRKNILIHRLVAEAFIPNPENKPFIDHINGDRSDNRVENLHWTTNRENQQNRSSHRAGRLVGARPTRGKYWRAAIMVNGKQKYLGYFPTEQLAHEAYLAVFANV